MPQITRSFGRPHHTLVPLLHVLAIAGIASRSHAAELPTDRDASGPAFQVSYSAGISRTPVSGRVYVFLGPYRSSAEPRLGPNWFRPQPFFAVDASGWKAG